MIRAESLIEQFRLRPFRPVRLVASEGLRYDIYHPDSVIVLERDIIIGMPQTDSGVFHKTVRVALVHLVAVEDLQPPPAVNSTAEEA